MTLDTAWHSVTHLWRPNQLFDTLPTPRHTAGTISSHTQKCIRPPCRSEFTSLTRHGNHIALLLMYSNHAQSCFEVRSHTYLYVKDRYRWFTWMVSNLRIFYSWYILHTISPLEQTKLFVVHTSHWCILDTEDPSVHLPVQFCLTRSHGDAAPWCPRAQESRAPSTARASTPRSTSGVSATSAGEIGRASCRERVCELV